MHLYPLLIHPSSLRSGNGVVTGKVVSVGVWCKGEIRNRQPVKVACCY